MIKNTQKHNLIGIIIIFSLFSFLLIPKTTEALGLPFAGRVIPVLPQIYCPGTHFNIIPTNRTQPTGPYFAADFNSKLILPGAQVLGQYVPSIGPCVKMKIKIVPITTILTFIPIPTIKYTPVTTYIITKYGASGF